MSECSSQENLCLHLSAQQGRRHTLDRCYTFNSPFGAPPCTFAPHLLHVSSLLNFMPSVQSSTPRPDSTGFTPRGERTPRGEHPRHTPRVGRPESTGKRHANDDFVLRDSQGKEFRDKLIEYAFMQPLDIVRGNSAAFVEALIHVLRKHGGVQTDADYAEIVNDAIFTLGSISICPMYFVTADRPTKTDRSASMNCSTMEARLLRSDR